MKTTYITLIIALVLVSCGKKEASVEDLINSTNLEKIRTKKEQLDLKQQELSNQIALLNARISVLDTTKKIPLISAFKVQEEVFDHYLEIQGDVKTKQNILIYPEMSGLLEAVYVKDGQAVVKGQILAKIDDAGMEQQLAQLEASAKLAKTTFERQERLWKQKIGSEIQYLQAETNYLTQKNAVAQLKQQLEKSMITAPFSGIIDEVFKEVGAVVAPSQGGEVFRIVNLQNMYIETEVPESYLKEVTKGKNVVVSFPILGNSLQTTIRQVSHYINPANRTFKIEVGVPNADKKVKPNLTAKLKINDYSNKKALLIPQNIISENAAGEQYVFVVTEINKGIGKAKKVIITTGKTQGDVIEVLSGLVPGDTLISEGARSVKDLQEVEIIQEAI